LEITDVTVDTPNRETITLDASLRTPAFGAGGGNGGSWGQGGDNASGGANGGNWGQGGN